MTTQHQQDIPATVGTCVPVEGQKDERTPADRPVPAHVYVDIRVVACKPELVGEVEAVYAVLQLGYEGVEIGPPIILGHMDLRYLSVRDVELALAEIPVFPDMCVSLVEGSNEWQLTGEELVDGVKAGVYLHAPIDPPRRISGPELYAAVGALQKKEDDNVLVQRMCARCAGPVADVDELLCSECRA